MNQQNTIDSFYPSRAEDLYLVQFLKARIRRILSIYYTKKKKKWVKDICKREKKSGKIVKSGYASEQKYLEKNFYFGYKFKSNLLFQNYN